MVVVKANYSLFMNLVEVMIAKAEGCDESRASHCCDADGTDVIE